MRCVWYISHTHVDITDEFKILLENQKGRPLESSGHVWDDNIKMSVEAVLQLRCLVAGLSLWRPVSVHVGFVVDEFSWFRIFSFGWIVSSISLPNFSFLPHLEVGYIFS
jgi:hypothetical protein